MKKLFILFGLVLFAVAAMAQDRTVSVPAPWSGTYAKYSGSSLDTLGPVDQDTIDIVFYYEGPGYVKKIAVKNRYDVVSGADTTVSFSLFGKEFSDDATYVQIIGATVSSDVNADNTIDILTSDWTETVAQYTSTIAQYNSTIASTKDTLAAYIALIDTTGLMGYPADSISYPAQLLTNSAKTLVNAAQTITNSAQTVTPLDKSYRYYRARYIITGTSAAGSGIKIDEVELKLYTE